MCRKFPHVQLLVMMMVMVAGCDHQGHQVLPGADRLPSDAPDGVYGLVNPYDADLRRAAIGVVARKGMVRESPYTDMLYDLCRDEDPTVRAAAVRALLSEPAVEDVDTLIGLVRDEAAMVRWESVEAMGRLNSQKLVYPLTRIVLNDDTAEVRAGAARALGQYQMPTVVDTLVRALDDSDFKVAQASEVSLKTLTGQDLGEDPADWARWVSEHPNQLFAEAQTYRYQPYIPPKKFLDRFTPWEDRDLEPRKPVSADHEEGVSS